MSKPASFRNLGRTELRVTTVGLGCWQFSRGHGLGGGYWTTLSEETVARIVLTTLEAGVNWFDTAEAYGAGESERVLSLSLKNLGRKPGDILIATKWRPALRTASSILATIDERLRRLGGYPIDLYQVHNPFSWSSVEAEMRAMARLVRWKRIRAVGVSNFSAGQMRRAARELEKQGLVLASNQVRYSLLDRLVEKNGVLETAKELGITLIAYSPLGQGILSGKFHEEPDLIKARPGYRKYLPIFKNWSLEKSRPVVEALRGLAAAHEATASQVALAWLIQHHEPWVVVIPGATRAEQSRENAGAMRLRLTRSEMDLLDRASMDFAG